MIIASVAATECRNNGTRTYSYGNAGNTVVSALPALHLVSFLWQKNTLPQRLVVFVYYDTMTP